MITAKLCMQGVEQEAQTCRACVNPGTGMHIIAVWHGCKLVWPWRPVLEVDRRGGLLACLVDTERFALWLCHACTEGLERG